MRRQALHIGDPRRAVLSAEAPGWAPRRYRNERISPKQAPSIQAIHRMFRILKQAVRTGIVTEPAQDTRDGELKQLGIERRRRIHARFGRSLAVRNVDAGSCNGRELEVQALNNPFHDLEQFGLRFVASSRHGDALLVTGPVSRRMETALRCTWRATPAPQTAVASGDCAC